MRIEIVKRYWRDNANPDPGRVTETVVRPVKRHWLQAPELIPSRIGSLPMSAVLKNRNYRNFTRKLSPAERRFVAALRRVVERTQGPTTCHREKICKALQIKAAMYFRLRERVDKK